MTVFIALSLSLNNCSADFIHEIYSRLGYYTYIARSVLHSIPARVDFFSCCWIRQYTRRRRRCLNVSHSHDFISQSKRLTASARFFFSAVAQREREKRKNFLRNFRYMKFSYFVIKILIVAQHYFALAEGWFLVSSKRTRREAKDKKLHRASFFVVDKKSFDLFQTFISSVEISWKVFDHMQFQCNVWRACGHRPEACRLIKNFFLFSELSNNKLYCTCRHRRQLHSLCARWC